MILVSKDDFMNWLMKMNYKELTDNGDPSTVFQYVNAIEKVMELENIETYSELTDHIQDLLKKYGQYGSRKQVGEEGHHTVINALKRFMEYLLNEFDFVPNNKIYYI